MGEPPQPPPPYNSEYQSVREGELFEKLRKGLIEIVLTLLLYPGAPYAGAGAP